MNTNIENENIEITDNYLDEEEWEEAIKILDNPDVPWSYSYILDEMDLMCDPKYNHQYIHRVIDGIDIYSKYYNNLKKVIRKLNCRSLLRIKVNAIHKEDEIITHGFHVDFGFVGNKYGNEGIKTSILYLNTNDGFTVFENGMKVESIANRMVTFPNEYRHSGTTCTDADRRIAVNFCYF